MYILESLVGGLEHFIFFHILGMSSSQLTNIFFRGIGQPRTRYLLMMFFIWGFSKIGVPLYRWMVCKGKSICKWMITRGTPITKNIKTVIYLPITVYIYIYLIIRNFDLCKSLFLIQQIPKISP